MKTETEVNRNSIKTINLPHLPKKFKAIRKWRSGEYSIFEEKGVEVEINIDRNGWVEGSLNWERKPAEEYIDISILEEAFEGLKHGVILIDHRQEKDMPVARVGSVFVLRNDPKRYYALTIKAGVVSVRNLNGISEWSKTFVPEDSNKITFGELESILPQNLKMGDLVFLPEPEELLKLLK